MTGAAAAFLAVALVLSALDWLAIARDHKPLEYVCKPVATVAFLATALALDPASDASRLWCCVALVCCLAGDVFLMLPRDAFLPGVGSFTIAQLCLVVSFWLQDPTAIRLVVGVVLVVPPAALIARRIFAALRRGGMGALAPAVGTYIVVITAMVVSAVTGGTAWGIAGAVLFLTSDSLIAEERFVAVRSWQSVTIMVTYHLALAGLVLGQL